MTTKSFFVSFCPFILMLLCFGIVNKYLRVIFWLSKKISNFCEKNNFFVKKLRPSYFWSDFILVGFLVLEMDPKIIKNPWEVKKVIFQRALIFLRNRLFFSQFLNIWRNKRNCHISACRAKINKLRPLSFLQLLKFEKRKCLYFFHFWPIWRDMASLLIFPFSVQKGLIYNAFSIFLVIYGSFVQKIIGSSF